MTTNETETELPAPTSRRRYTEDECREFQELWNENAEAGKRAEDLLEYYPEYEDHHTLIRWASRLRKKGWHFAKYEKGAPTKKTRPRIWTKDGMQFKAVTS